jgi:hypothetical protein
MSDKTDLLRAALKKSRMEEIMKHFAPKKANAEVHEHEMVGEGHTPEEALKNLHDTHSTSNESCPMCKGGIAMSKGGITVSEEETLPDLNSEEHSPEYEDSEADEGKVPLGDSADLDNVPAIAALRRRKDKNTRV